MQSGCSTSELNPLTQGNAKVQKTSWHAGPSTKWMQNVVVLILSSGLISFCSFSEDQLSRTIMEPAVGWVSLSRSLSVSMPVKQHSVATAYDILPIVLYALHTFEGLLQL